MTEVFHTTRCFICAEPFPDGFSKPCPKCGEVRKIHDVLIHETLTATDSVSWKHIHEYYEKSPVLLPLVILITVGSPFLGLFLAGWAGVVAGLAIGLITFYIGLRAVTKVREIREGT